jgi:hypothetical protein
MLLPYFDPVRINNENKIIRMKTDAVNPVIFSHRIIQNSGKYRITIQIVSAMFEWNLLFLKYN